jgi:hypothetical protein
MLSPIVAAMPGPDDFLATHLSTLRLSRELVQEFPNTRVVCLNNSWNPVLANEVRLRLPFPSQDCLTPPRLAYCSSPRRKRCYPMSCEDSAFYGAICDLSTASPQSSSASSLVSSAAARTPCLHRTCASNGGPSRSARHRSGRPYARTTHSSPRSVSWTARGT